MINQKYYYDIKNFPEQFPKGMELAKEIKVNGLFKEVVLCGMGGSSLFVGLINDLLESNGANNIRIKAIKGYDLPKYYSQDSLYILSSYSGNTEEVLNLFGQIKEKGLSHFVITAGGKLEELANQNNSAILKIPGGIQPRLSTGYFISGIIQILINSGIIPGDLKDLIIEAAKKISASLDEEKAKALSEKIYNKVPIIYSTDNNSSLAHISKIKFNENTKIQAFWNFFPELNHNEMVGYTKLIMNPFFLIFKSQYTNPQNYKRINIFKKLLNEKGVEVEILDLKGANIFEEILMGYYFIDHLTYYLAEKYGIDPEPVKMVEDFKKLLEE